MSTSVSVNEPSPHDSDQSLSVRLSRGHDRSHGLIMRWPVGIVWAVGLAAALGVLLLRFSPSQVNPNSRAAEASSSAIFPIELHPMPGGKAAAW